ncbi:mucin-5AC-like isoform X2 [Cottoperca gobio]|uniref:Mucin-5AC-like isoform X2 n=1 Tax=Cottoperca gobio TaxID=56716 RepID=A0A6J2QDU3_COTGO|nr:mucin-5AC-like isoform X2 [Cottoperca gobio]
MSANDFQTKYSSVMESMLNAAIAETTKLFETMVDELKAELSKIKKENEELKTRCCQFEKARNQPTVCNVTRESEHLPGPSDGSERRDRAIQCDLVPFRTVLVEQCQPLRPQEMEYSLQDHNYGEGTTQMAFIVVKQESVVKQEEVQATAVCGLVLSDKADSPQASVCGAENEGPLLNQECSTGKIPMPQKDVETPVALELSFLGIDSSLQGAQNQSSELMPSLVISLASINDNMEEEYGVSQKFSETQGEVIASKKHSVVVAQHQSEAERPLEREKPSVVPQRCQREGKTSVNEQDDVTLQSTGQCLEQRTRLDKEKACEKLKSCVAEGEVSPQPELSGQGRRGRPPNKSKRLQRPVNETGSPAVSVASLSKNCSSKKKKTSESQQLSIEKEKGTIHTPSTEVLSASKTLNTPTGQPRERRSSVTLQDAMLLVEAMNQSTVDMAVPLKTQCAPHVVTLQTVDEVPAEPQTPPLPLDTHKAAEKLSDTPVTTDATPTNEAQVHNNVVIPKQQHKVTPSHTATSLRSSSTVAIQTSVRSLQQHPPCLLRTSVASSKLAMAVSRKIILVPRSVSLSKRHEMAARCPTQLPTVLSKVIAAQSILPGSTTAGLPLGSPSVSSVPQKTIYITSLKSVPVVASHSTATSTDPQSEILQHSKITIIIPRQVSAVTSRKHQSQTTVLNTKQGSAKSAAPVKVTTPQLISSSHELSVSVDIQTASDVVATMSQKKDKTSDPNLESPKQTDSVSEPINAPTKNCSCSNSASPALPPTAEQKLSAVVRLTRLPFTVSAKEAVLVSRTPTDGSTETQFISKEALPLNTSQMLEEPNDIQEKASLSSEYCTILEDSPNSGLSTTFKVSAPVFENSTIAINTTEPPAVSVTTGEATTNLDEEYINIAVEACASANGPQIEEKQSASLIHLTPITTKDTSDPHSLMTKAQFLAQLAVTPVTQDPTKASYNDAVDVTPLCAETSTSDKKRLQTKSIVAKLRSHLKTRLQARRTKTNPCTETNTRTVHPKNRSLKNDSPKDKNTTGEYIPLSPKNPAAVKDVTSPKKKTNDPTSIRPRISGLGKAGIGLKRTVSEPTTVSSKRFKASPRRSSTGPDGVGSKTKKSTSVRPSLIKTATPKKTKSTSVSPRRSSSIKESASPKNTKSTSVRSSSIKESASSKKTKIISVRPGRISSIRDGASPKSTNTTSVGPKRNNLSKTGTSPKVSFKESPSFCRRRCTLPKDVLSSAQIKRESNSFSPRYSITAEDASDKIAKIGTGSPSVRWPKLVKNGVKPRKTRESTLVKKARLSQDGSGPKNNLRVVNAKKLARAAKAKTIAKMRNSSQSKLQNGAKTSQLAENREVVRKCITKAVWTPTRMSASRTPPAGGKKETRSPDQPLVFPPSVSLFPIPVKGPPVVSPLQPLSVIGRRLLKNQCGECGRVLSSIAALESHVRLHTGRRPFSCTLCGKSFTDSKGLKRHGRVHRNGRIHVCQQCGKGFVYRFGLTKHLQMVHRRIKPFICQICHKGFFTKRDVEAHIRMHTGEKPFHCNLCEKKFARRVELNVHLRWHNGEKRHWCPYCGKGFLDFNNLKRHKYIHTGEKPHSCPHCPKNFTQSGHLKKHVKNVHKIP